jgi:predicted enzyme involved in methoxymalonyl-ACP biosynthesis
MTSITLDKEYVDNLHDYIKKLEEQNYLMSENNKQNISRINHLFNKVKNIKRNRTRLNNKYNKLRDSKCVKDSVDASDLELEWINIDEN